MEPEPAESLFTSHKIKKFLNKQYTTDYICHDIPWRRLDLDSESAVGLQIPFKEGTLLPTFLKSNEFQLKDAITHRESKYQHYVPCLERLKSPNTSEGQCKTIYEVAQQWCKSNEQLVERLNQPLLIDNCLLKGKFSRTHQRATVAAKKEAARLKSQVDVDSSDQQGPSERDLNKVHAEDTVTYGKLGDILDKLMSNLQDISQPPTKITSKSQYKLIEPNPTKVQEKYEKIKAETKKKPWKKNVYPPKTKRDVIEERRKACPPLLEEFMEVDYLPGIWEPQLLVNEFRITGPNYDSRTAHATAALDEVDESYEPVDWYKKQLSREKCSEWLESVGNDL